jgi:trimeric autotransporter adhesin
MRRRTKITLPHMKTTASITRSASVGMLRALLGLLVGWFCTVNTALALPPLITAQPTNRTVQVGSNATFAVTVTSGSAVTYQWYFQSNALAGATNNTYTRTNVQLSHAGPYYVAVTNADGSAQSSNAVLTVTSVLLSGTVFEDANYGGGSGRTFTGASGVGVAEARVELYSAAGSFLGFGTSGPGGAYTIPVVAQATYTLRVVNRSVASSRSGYTTNLLAVQTFRTDAASGTPGNIIDRVGGENPALVDAGNGSTTLAALTNSTTTVQSLTSVTVDTSNISGLDFGFNFDTIVNTNNAGQGSLRQFILNANALAGADRTLFMISDGAAHPGLRAGLPNQLTGAVGALFPPRRFPLSRMLSPCSTARPRPPTWAITTLRCWGPAARWEWTLSRSAWWPGPRWRSGTRDHS